MDNTNNNQVNINQIDNNQINNNQINNNQIVDTVLSDKPINETNNQIDNNQIDNNQIDNNQINNNQINNVLSDQPINETNNQINNNQINNVLSDQPINETHSNEEITNKLEDKQRKILGLNVSKWGIVSAVANFSSVVFQLYRTVKTQKVKSFSMKFISLMTFLNFVYVIIGILTENHGMTFACLVFVVYNLIIVYYYYFGKSE
jgi:hypothetical protein